MRFPELGDRSHPRQNRTFCGPTDRGRSESPKQQAWGAAVTALSAGDLRVSTKAAFLTAVLAAAMAIVLLHGPAQCGDCCDYRPLWIPPSQPIPPWATHTG